MEVYKMARPGKGRVEIAVLVSLRGEGNGGAGRRRNEGTAQPQLGGEAVAAIVSNTFQTFPHNI